jgi:hypothetical protein
MLALQEYYNKVLEETDRQHVIEIPISGAGQLASFETASLTGMHDIIGIGLINPNPTTAGHGTLRLRIGDEEILPNGFHANMISKFSHRFVTTDTEFGFKEYLFPTKVQAKGRPVKIEYTEPTDGGSGSLFLYLLGKSNNSNFSIPKYRIQVIDIDVPKGDISKDVEIEIKEKTLQSHEKVVGAMFLGLSNRIKKVKLSIDDSTVFPEGFQGQLITKEIISNSIINTASGIFTKHIIPFSYMIHPVDQKARNSKIEGKIWATPKADSSYKIYLYILTIA